MLLVALAARISKPSNSVVKKYLPPLSKKADISILFAEVFWLNRLVSLISSCGVPLLPVLTLITSETVLTNSSSISIPSEDS